MKNMLIHIPHSSYIIPEKYKKLFCLSDKEIFKEQIKMTDSYTDELFNVTGITKMIFPISRLICDVERFRDESKEEMTRQGMWVCYTKTSSLNPLKRVTEKHKQNILKLYYDKHHFHFEKQIENMLKEHKQNLIIDAHSFSSTPLPYELHSQNFRPDICIGTNNFHTPNRIAEYFYNAFTELGYKVGINNPFCGTIVPLKFYNKDKRVSSIMIEVNRSLYMNESNGKKSANFDIVKKDINKIISSLNIL